MYKAFKKQAAKRKNIIMMFVLLTISFFIFKNMRKSNQEYLEIPGNKTFKIMRKNKCLRVHGKDDIIDHKDHVTMVDCDNTGKDRLQYWTYDNKKNQIKTSTDRKRRKGRKGEKLCLDYNGKEYKVTKCNGNPAENRKFTFDVPIKIRNKDNQCAYNLSKGNNKSGECNDGNSSFNLIM
jgi:hypothetical protein